jgi:polysaccharide deacetylase 2 family uncharacterized protein YibQ
MLTYVLITLAAIAAGYLFARVFLTEAQPPVQTSVLPPGVEAPPAVLSSPRVADPSQRLVLPASPIFPEGLGQAPQPYEEALPSESHLPAPLPRTTSPPASAKPSAAVPAWKQFALAAPAADGRPRIAVVIDDLGLDRKRSAEIMALSGPLTLSFLTYAQDLDQQTALGRARGHELMVHFPMEPAGQGIDAGPNALSVGLSPEEILKRLRWGLSHFDGFIGINNHMGSRFTTDAAGMTTVLTELKSRGLMFLDSRTTGKTVGPRLAVELGVPHAERNVFLDNVDDVEAVKSQLHELEAVARKSGHAIAIGHPRTATIRALNDWLGTLTARGFQLVPLSALVREETGAG